MHKVLVLGASGMIGSTMFRYLTTSPNLEVFGAFRGQNGIADLEHSVVVQDLRDREQLQATIAEVRPNTIINCAGITKHVHETKIATAAIATNALLPHELIAVADIFDARVVHISTDCVFSGRQGHYSELCATDAADLYGRTKAIGEFLSEKHLVLRTSTIGHELSSTRGLVEWFLSQEDKCFGYTNAWFSGLTSLEIAKIMLEIIIPDPSLSGLYNIGGSRINKHDLLVLLAEVYKKKIKIIPNASPSLDRSLNSSRFRSRTHYSPPSWGDLVIAMHEDWRVHGQNVYQ